MDESLLEIRTWRGKGYKPLVDFGGWRVAVFRFLEELCSDKIESMERHVETDEVFVLVEGRGVLVIGDVASRVDRALPKVMHIAEVC